MRNSALQFFFVVAIVCAGGFFIALPWAPHVQYQCAAFFGERTDLFIPLGALLLTVGLILGIGFYFLERRAYVQLKMSPLLHIEKGVLQGMIDVYWKGRFGEGLKTGLRLHDEGKIEFIAELPPLKELDPQKLLSDIENEVAHLLVDKLGYKKEFFFTFQIK